MLPACAWAALSPLWLHVVATAQEVADVAADYGIEYGLEVVNRYETNIANTGVQVCRLALAMQRKHIAML